MTTRNLEALFAPRSVALIGASNRSGTVGAVVARNLLATGFRGPIMPVNPHEQAIGSTLSYRTIADLPLAPDLAVIATPAASVPALVGELGARGCRAAIVISAGFAPGGDLQKGLLQSAKPNLVRIVGPNCLGFISPRTGLNASFAHLTPRPGHLALVTQSGAIAAAALDWAATRDIGFSHVATIGDAIDVDIADLLDYLALDIETRAIVVYVESIRGARKFMTAARIASRNKPVVVLKSGRSEGGARAAFSHTGAIAGSDAVYDAAFARAGMLRVDTLRELFDAVEILTANLALSGDRLGIVTNGGGAGVMAVDALEQIGGHLAKLSEQTTRALHEALPANASVSNPVDILGDAPPERYETAIGAVQGDLGVDALLVLNCPTAVADSTQAAEAVISAVKAARDPRPVFTCWLGSGAVQEGRRRLSAAGIATHETPEEAVRAFIHLARHRRNQVQLLQTPSAASPDIGAFAAARALVDTALQSGQAALTGSQVRQLLKLYGVPIIESVEASDPEAAAIAAARIGGPVALKIASPDITHKSDLGGVILGLRGADDVREAAQRMRQRIAAAAPHAKIAGFTVEPMVRRPLAEELIVGLAQDQTFGPVVVFGRGGVAVELDPDRAIQLAPLDDGLARDLIARTRIAGRLGGYRGRPPVDLGAVSAILVALSRLALDLPEVRELDINPLLADAGGALGLDARVRIGPRETAIAPAICPYPDHLARTIELGEATLTLRPIRPSDADGLKDLVAESSQEDVRLRFRASVRRLPDAWARRLSQIDYDREMALVAVSEEGAVAGVARLAGDPQGEQAEFALLVRSQSQNQGLGRTMLRALLDFAKTKGLASVWGEVALENASMLEMADAFGFQRAPSAEPDCIKIIKTLKESPDYPQ